MIANYHTHTWRCGHAYGTEREYIEKAIESGLQVLGFSDHTPYFYTGGFVSRDKMLPSQLEGYVTVLSDLRREYQDEIRIHIGLEVEYYPALWDGLMRFLAQYPIEYMILGQHYLDNEIEDHKYGAVPTRSAQRLHKYCTQCMEALETGKFLYFAHPDLLNFIGDEEVYEEEMTALCRFCLERSIPLELNLLGLREGRNYPRTLFWKIAGRVGNTVVYGSDAHRPEHVCSPAVIAKADSMMRRCGVSAERVASILPVRQ